MDGASLQKEQAERLKREIRDKAPRRREERAVEIASEGVHTVETTRGDHIVLDQTKSTIQTVRGATLPPEQISETGRKTCPKTTRAETDRRVDCTLARADTRDSIGFGRGDTVLLMFYIEHVNPFLFPFYRPSPLEGGKAWILEMMISSPVVRQAALSQSSYCYSHEHNSHNHEAVWETVLTQARDAFEVLRQSLQVIGTASISEHLHGAVRILASIMQVQRFEVTVLSFENCQAHLNAALALFQQILGSTVHADHVGVLASFNDVFERLGPPSWVLPAGSVQVPSAEQAAFRFSAALLILDDIIASTVLQEQPKLYQSHQDLLESDNGNEPCVNLEAVIGCQNWALRQLGEVAVLDAWKQQCKRSGNLDVMELVRRAVSIEAALKDHLARLDANSEAPITDPQTNVLSGNAHSVATPSISQTLITRIWAHSALLYLSMVVSGWQPANLAVQRHVQHIMGLISNHMSPPSLLRTVVWPFCLAGCLAGPELEPQFRAMVVTLQPPGMFVAVRKAVEIMENVWRSTYADEMVTRDFASCIRDAGGFVLLV
ncbi:hypothetical protein K491DRAFT_585990 [Lophiostoma macrostomum CBS 122681]|uniref:Fungal-specific transcription factor domain-containing protein n=1 Tax=Lophiostoma macrostomum CBS 122681 TaxID=1314788 RepID=A0A6A6TQC4_9PLEO|nr:hypothetical protein K491DRAFT_585990 [Lophiostoma macrostomum CBS 122681]